jgi:hypothetical protein
MKLGTVGTGGVGTGWPEKRPLQFPASPACGSEKFAGICVLLGLAEPACSLLLTALKTEDKIFWKYPTGPIPPFPLGS